MVDYQASFDTAGRSEQEPQHHSCQGSAFCEAEHAISLLKCLSSGEADHDTAQGHCSSMPIYMISGELHWNANSSEVLVQVFSRLDSFLLRNLAFHLDRKPVDLRGQDEIVFAQSADGVGPELDGDVAIAF